MASGMGNAGARLGAAAQIIAAIAALFITSALIGSFITPHLPQALKTPILALALWGGVLAGAVMLAVSKTSYGAIGFAPPKSVVRCVLWAVAAIVISELGAILIGEAIRRTTGWAPLDIAYIRDSIRGNLTAYFVWVGLVVWGSAAFGEELLSRGFILDRLQVVFGRGPVGIVVAVIGQAAAFGALHAIQGPTGIVITAWIGLVLAGAYFASGRNLWAPILAHGLMDTMSLTLMFLDKPLPGFIR